MIELLNLKKLDCETIYVRYILDDRVITLTSRMEKNNLGHIKYKPFSLKNDDIAEIEHIKNIYSLIIERFIDKSKTELFDSTFNDDSFYTYCQGGYLNIKYLVDRYKFSNSLLNIFNIIEIIDGLYPLEERRMFENFNNLYFSSLIIQKKL